jgi:predicted phage gp36 major capsid-like protein
MLAGPHHPKSLCTNSLRRTATAGYIVGNIATLKQQNSKNFDHSIKLVYDSIFGIIKTHSLNFSPAVEETTINVLLRKIYSIMIHTFTLPFSLP